MAGPYNNEIIVDVEAPMSTSLYQSAWTNNDETITITITDFIAEGDEIEKDSDLKFSVSKLRTPLTTKSSESFKLYIRDKDGNLINYIITDMRATMQLGKFMKTVGVSSSSPRVGDRAGHAVYFDTVVPLEDSDQLVVIYPPETFPPLKDPRCEGSEMLARWNSCSVV